MVGKQLYSCFLPDEQNLTALGKVMQARLRMRPASMTARMMGKSRWHVRDHVCVLN